MSREPTSAFAALKQEDARLRQAAATLRATVSELEGRLGGWVDERPSRAWLATSVATGQRFVPARQAARPRRSAAIRASTVRRNLLQVAGAVCNTLQPGTDGMARAADLCAALDASHATDGDCTATIVWVQPSVHTPQAPNSWELTTPMHDEEAALFRAEEKAPAHQQNQELGWPLLQVLRARLVALARRRAEVSAGLQELQPVVVQALARSDSKTVDLGSEHGSLRLQQGSARRRPFTQQSVAAAACAFLEQHGVDAETARRAGQAMAQHLSKLDVQAGNRSERKRATQRGRWIK